jgi:tetratricopeptide (TPR) repeat protein
LLGLDCGPDIALAAVASLAGRPMAETRRLMAGLVRVNLAGEPVPGRYVLHDLLRAYAGELAASTGTDAELTRLRDHYLHTAAAAALRLHPARLPIPLPPPAAGVIVEEPGDPAAWFRAERHGLVAAVYGSDDRYAWRLAWTLADYLDREGLWQDWLDTQTAAAAAAERLGDLAWQLFAYRSTAGAAIRLRRFDLSREMLEQSRSLAAGLGDLRAHAQAEFSLAWLLEEEGNPAAARPYAQRAAVLFAEAGEHRFAARARSSTGWHAALTGDLAVALTICTRELEEQRSLEDRAGLAGTLDSLGYIHHQQGRAVEAAARYREAISTYQQESDRIGEANTRVRLATTLEAAGDDAGARGERRLALAILTDVDPAAAAELRDLLAE